MPSIPAYTIEDIRRIYLQTFFKGFTYAQEERVSQLIWTASSGLLGAQVKGSTRNPYGVSIQITMHSGISQFASLCTCPVGHNCKHVVATLFEGLRHGVSFEVETSVEPVLDASLSSWLNSFEEPSPEPVLDSGKKLIYVLDASKGQEAFQVSPFSTSILKSGQFSTRTDRYIPENMNSYNRPKFMRDIDLTIIRLLLVSSGYRNHYDFFRVHVSQEGLLLLKMLIESKSCYLPTYQSPQDFLVSGESKHGVISWQADSEGLQRIHVDVEGVSSPIILASQPLHYICPLSKEVGVLHTALSDKEAIRMLNAPPVKPQQVSLFSEKLSKVLKAPTPNLVPISLPVRHLTDPPIPCLTLKSIKIQPQRRNSWGSVYEHGDPVLISVGILSFFYGDTEVSPQDPKTEINRFENGGVLSRSRDKALEKGVLESIPHFSLNMNLKSVERDYWIKEDMKSFWTIGEPKAEFHKDKTLPKQWAQFMQDGIPEMIKNGWTIKIDRDFSYNVIKPDDDWYAEVGEEPGNDWFGVELGVTVEGKRLNLVPILLQLLKEKDDIFKTIESLSPKTPLIVEMKDGRKLALPAQRVKILLNTLRHLFSFQTHLDPEGRLKLKALDAALLAEMEASSEALNMRWYGEKKTLELGKKLRSFTEVQPVSLPKSFHGELRHYQQEGVNWLQFLREYGLAGILADDMGLGKTVQVLAHMAIEKAEKRLKKPFLVIAPTSLMVNWRMEAERFVPGLKVLVLHGPQRKEHFKSFKQYDLILTTYPLLPRDKDVLLACEYHTIVLDEAQTIKNTRAKLTQIANQLKADHRLCMTGTPMENHLGELWSLFHFLLPGYLGTLKQFGTIAQDPVTLSRRIKPFVLRRTKHEVMTELPPKTEMIRMVELEGTQLDLYETIRSSMHEKVKKEIAEKGMDKSHIIVLDALLKLRQVCCDPALLKIESAKHVKESAKRDELMAMLEPMVEEGRKILLFSQFTSMLALIEKDLAALKIPYVKLTGQTVDRETPVRRFQEGEVPLFLISLKAGGTGLNLTAADTVIHYDPWWNPAVENQATDRAYRIGQDKPVFVYKLITSGTVEEKIVEMQQKKHKLMESLFDPAEKSSGKLSARDIQALFEPI